MQCWLFEKFGVQVVFDSYRYIEDANRLLSSGEFRLSYVSYTLLLAAFLKGTGAVAGVVWVQLAFSLAATVAFFKLVYHFSASAPVAFLAGFLLVVWPDYQQWNFYVHTEALFVSITLIAFLRMATARRKWAYLQLALLLVFLVFLRSNGFMVALAVASYLASDAWLKRGWRLRWLFAVIVGGGTPLFILLAHLFLADMSGLHAFTDHLVTGNVIQGYEGVRVEATMELALTGSPLQQVLQLVWQEPGFFFKRSALRFIYYWGQIRPYFAGYHNGLIGLFFYPQYALALYGILKRQVYTPLLIAMGVLAVLLTAMVLVSGVDWDNRFMLPLLPFIYLTAMAGLQKLAMPYSKPQAANLLQQ
ncbi:hypothetical protein MKJ04_11115 [Pontibacter sp. E15-1]|uniref:hypothetical protein n=1 Tax=Pontibacter sp. E15-1 TaxID=2919918 RepID=UPI001F4F8EEC|nr:hypothetical protein [Pontibacter sp. E15-1]MCJ8165393.1 hypothetical protein [Pontibacter sp. E15-1]